MANVFKPPCEDGIIRAGRPAAFAAADPAIGRRVLTATILASGIAFSDATSTNVALPALQAEMGATVTDVQWVVEAYALFLAALILVGGALGDRLGRRRVFAWGMGLFTAASLACGLAPSIDALIGFRAVQGIGAALLVPGSLAIISATFRPEDRGRAIGTWSGFSAIAAGVGPVLGGWLIDTLSWRWIFYMNVPFVLAALVITLRHVPETRDEDAAGRLDLPGAGLATLGLGGIVFGMIESAHRGFGHPVVLAALGLGAGGAAAFLAWEARSRSPMMPLSLFGSRAFSGANLLTLLLYAALGGGFFFLPLNLIQVQGYSATAAGAALFPFILLVFSLSRWAGGLADRYGARVPLIAGPTLAGLGYLLMALPGIGGSYWTTFFPAVVVLGLGMAVTVAPLTTVVMTSVEQRRAGVASGINNAVARTASVVAVALFGVIALGVFNSSLDRRIDGLQLTAEAHGVLDRERINLAAAEPPAGLYPEIRAALDRAIDSAFVDGFRAVMIVAVALSLASAAVAGRTIRDARG